MYFHTCISTDSCASMFRIDFANDKSLYGDIKEYY